MWSPTVFHVQTRLVLLLSAALKTYEGKEGNDNNEFS